MKIINLISLILFVVILSWAWQQATLPLKILVPGPTVAEGLDKTGPEASGVYMIKDLPCFKCHIYSRFAQEPAPGVFSHALHIQFEYHCNQCHSFLGHRRMVINTEVCTFCHEAVPELKKH